MTIWAPYHHRSTTLIAQNQVRGSTSWFNSNILSKDPHLVVEFSYLLGMVLCNSKKWQCWAQEKNMVWMKWKLLNLAKVLPNDNMGRVIWQQWETQHLWAPYRHFHSPLHHHSDHIDLTQFHSPKWQYSVLFDQKLSTNTTAEIGS